MDCSPGKGDGSGSNCPTMGAYVDSFFKFVMDPGSQKLMLPPEFSRKYGQNLQDCVSLTVPSGLVWQVELTHSNGRAWLQGGWEKFSEYYSLCVGHCLVFKYVGNSHFEVHIFDTTATEIEYSHYDSLSSDAGSNQVAGTEGIESDSDDSVVFSRETFTGMNVRGRDQDDRSEKLRKSSGKEKTRSSPVKESRFMASS